MIPAINPEDNPPPGGTLRLSWPLTPDVFTATGHPARPTTTATAAQNIPFGRGYPVELSTPNTTPIGGDVRALVDRLRCGL